MSQHSEYNMKPKLIWWSNFTIWKYVLSWCLFWYRPVAIHGTSRPTGKAGWLTSWCSLENRLSSGLAADGEESPTPLTPSAWRGHGAQRWHTELDRGILNNWKHWDVAHGFFFGVDVPSRWPQFGIGYCGFLKNFTVLKSIALNRLRWANTHLEIVPFVQRTWNRRCWAPALFDLICASVVFLIAETAEWRNVKELCTIVIHRASS